MKLTTKQKLALTYIGETPQKSGAFWRDLGISPTTLAALERMGLAEGKATSYFQTTGLRQQWHVTRAGRAALEARPIPDGGGYE